jgi:anti-repressor protein
MRLKRDSATRILGIGNPSWVASEVCQVLGIRNHRMALSRLDDDEKQLVILNDPHGKPQKTLMINEPGLYHLIEGSRKKEAEVFKKWVRTDVLPQIRKTGSYSSTALPDSSKMTKLDWIKVALQTEEQLLIAETKVAELGPKAQIYDLIANAKGLTGLSDTAKLRYAASG